MDRSHGGEVQDDEGHDGEEDTTSSTDDIVENLGDWLIYGVCEQFCGIAAAIRQHNRVKPSTNPSEAEGQRNGPGSFDGGILDLLSDMSRRIVIRLLLVSADSAG